MLPRTPASHLQRTLPPDPYTRSLMRNQSNAGLLSQKLSISSASSVEATLYQPHSLRHRSIVKILIRHVAEILGLGTVPSPQKVLFVLHIPLYPTDLTSCMVEQIA
jgi:hypothetical protein